MIEIENVVKAYGQSVVVDDVALNLPRRGITSIIGPNGAGKSTLLSMVSRLLPMDRGRIVVGGLGCEGHCRRRAGTYTFDTAPGQFRFVAAYRA